ncbi:DUF4188 domain-containing protein [Kineosporia babensis]|uniref:DUF4188 domain-containing protein n=1 Tax=Kineosporia babensis TaxID=499548 RepID=A0A9X1SY74_9ACTN|nr:DUF4188 domain-containing protein [Kineosporia babensis]MCD5310768.1 DUF4188 domain-containing protein [Kineosporia babensis]
MARNGPGRMMHRHDGDLVVFHIGMTLNRWWRPDLWLPVMLGMPRMLAELERDKNSGLLGYEVLIGRGGPYTVQYWTSAEKLAAYASAPGAQHLPAWSRFNAMARKHPGAVGIWHETFVVERAESLYIGTRPMGLPKATTAVPVGPQHRRAQARLKDGATGGRSADHA